MIELTDILNNLHDAILEDIKLNWENGGAIMSLKLHEPDAHKSSRIKIFCQDVVLLNINRRFDWGKSIHVNEAIKLNRHTIKIEMQSGDNIQIQAAHFDFKIESTFMTDDVISTLRKRGFIKDESNPEALQKLIDKGPILS